MEVNRKGGVALELGMEAKLNKGRKNNVRGARASHVLACHCLDHSPLLVSYARTEDVTWRKCKNFRFESSWTRHKEQADIVKKVWCVKHHGPNPWSLFHEKLHGYQKSLKQWSDDTNPAQEAEAATKADLDAFLEEEDIIWRQRAKEDWLKFSDRNTKYFHACDSQRQEA
ncbi:uncharacterized protein LOC133860279 [Alnus glutinosa]|uniref:uncharacterized protein LOC133860279 n=1 Tax=Alnus glutinosa TaxID=3517 RepID=UPI002D79DE1F|nr:uncharacterized protein LOC133860279 [Alnus glutinosa]